ncbi:insecticidal delta-endotoxin Cry8Ea1 family protein, partial [Bacillus mycoides]|uniref:insecticidal delta-endotoxin Cry8Ea1 family protein n=1 Tax=Bacillus mycoides TaxID=1405 RepID=UPI003D6546D7
MNQNYGNNNDEIMNNDGGCYSPRYPLANAPGSALQNMNYQDVMNSCMGKAYNIGEQNVKSAVNTTTDIFLQILNLSFPGLSVAGGIIQSIFGLLWPTDTQAVWDTFMNAVENLIDQKLDNYARNTAIAKLQGLHNTLREYNDRLAIYTDDPSETHAQNLRTQVLITDNLFELSMPEFAVRDYETQLLTVYAQAANLHLAFLRDIVKFGAEWGFTPKEIEDFHRGMKERTVEYTNHCVNTYNKGLEKAKTLAANPCDLNTYPWTRYNQGWREEEKPNCTLQQINSCDQQLNEFHEQGNPYM